MVVRWVLDAAVRIVVVGIVRVGGGVLLAVAPVVDARGRARSAVHVGIPGTSAQMHRTGGKVVGWREVGCERDKRVVGDSHVPSAGAVGGAMPALLGGERISAGNGGGIALVHGETAGRGGLPIDGLEAVLELTRGAKLPLADDGPDGGGTDDARSSDDEGDDDGLGKEGCILVLGLV